MLTLGIETTCDETAAAVVQDGKTILSNVIFSQAKLHEKYGGVFPEMASRCHVTKMLPVIDVALKEAQVSKEELDLIAVAHGPGLIGSLLVGLNTAKALSLAWDLPFIGINHIEAHLYAAMMQETSPLFPALGVVISGGHTQILYIRDIGEYSVLGSTIDDAIGECFDKVASLLDLPYPGGPMIEKLAREGDENKYPFHAGQVRDNPLSFSFSGLKTKVLYTVKGQKGHKDKNSIIPEVEKKHIAASFQKTALMDIISKVVLASKNHEVKAIYAGGGVSNNQKLRELFLKKNLSIPLFWPSKGLSLDNAVMIAALGYQQFLKKRTPASFDLEAKTRLSLCSF